MQFVNRILYNTILFRLLKSFNMYNILSKIDLRYIYIP